MPFEVLEVQPTPNPNAAKFILNTPISENTLSFFNAAQAKDHPVASQLFAIKGVTGIMLLGDFVTISKSPDAKWPAISSQVQQVLSAA